MTDAKHVGARDADLLHRKTTNAKSSDTDEIAKQGRRRGGARLRRTSVANRATLARTTFTTSRILEFCSEKELRIQTGAAPDQWPLVVLKELVDNALDAAEEAGIAPRIAVTVADGKIIIADNGPGIPPSTIKAILDFSIRVSSREAYVSPTRGAQGNALKTILAMPYALDGGLSRVGIEAHGSRHAITFRADVVRQTPNIGHDTTASPVKTGTRVTVHWPETACSNLLDAKDRFLQNSDDYTWLNPHLDLAVEWNGERRHYPASVATWEKWLPSQPTCPHWYNQARLERLIGAHVTHGRNQLTVRQFISEFRGLSGTAKQAAVLERIGLSRAPLESLCPGGEFDKSKIAALLAAMKAAAKPAKAQHLGLIGKDHLTRRMVDAGAERESITYSRQFDTNEGVPCAIEFAFGWCPQASGRRLITGINWSPGITNPFRQLGRYGESLDTILSQQRLDREEPVIVVLHVAWPRAEYLDRGKSAVAISGEDQ
jgi:DNA topoisomerase VI subunit B